MKLLLAVCVSLLIAGTCFADTLQVPSKEYPTIESAIEASVKGDTIAIAAGTYYESGLVIDTSMLMYWISSM